MSCVNSLYDRLMEKIFDRKDAHKENESSQNNNNNIHNSKSPPNNETAGLTNIAKCRALS